MKRIDLNGIWNLQDDEGHSYTAHVPGCVHRDILQEDLFFRDTYERYQWIERHDYTYSRTFTVEEVLPEAFLHFEGLDVYCDIFLNDVCIASTDNMFIPHRIPVDGVLKQGENQLRVLFHSPVVRTENYPKRNAAFTCERLYTRRIQCTYGWDWVARFVTCGIFRPVYLEFDSDFRIDQVYLYTDIIDEFGAVVRLEGKTIHYEPGALTEMRILTPSGECVWHRREFINYEVFSEYINIEHPLLWYPAGYGDQPLYTLEITLPNQRFVQKFGIRKVRIIETVDQPGSPSYAKCLTIKDSPSGLAYDQNEEFSSFILSVNGIRIMCRGANFVPSEPFVSDETPEKLTRLLELARECNVNMLRVWGGGIFEQSHFYDECDRLGIMVTQDFLMACGSYPEEEDWFIEQIREEAAFAALHLRNHPCLMWWSGDNENAVNGSAEDENYMGKRSAFHGIQPVLSQLDPARRLLPSSPYGGKKYASKTVGTTHNTQYLGFTFDYLDGENLDDYQAYFDHLLARFVAEEPTLGAVVRSSLLKMMTEEDFAADDMTMWYKHTKSNPALKHELFDYLRYPAEKILGSFQDPQDRHFKLQYLQYEWIRITLENFRRNKWFSSGLIYWMFSDCWPAAAGWTFVDYYCQPKASFYGFKRTASPLISSIECLRTEENGHSEGNVRNYCVSVCSELLSDQPLQLDVFAFCPVTGARRPLLSDKVLAKANEVTTLPAFSCELNNEILISEIRYPSTSDCACCQSDTTVTPLDRSFYKDGPLNIASCSGIHVRMLNDQKLEVSADRYVHAVCLTGIDETGKDTEGIFSDNWFSLLPGERRIITYRSTSGIPTDFRWEAYTLVSGSPVHA